MTSASSPKTSRNGSPAGFQTNLELGGRFSLSQPVLRSSTAEGGRERVGDLASEASANSCVVHLWVRENRSNENRVPGERRPPKGACVLECGGHDAAFRFNPLTLQRFTLKTFFNKVAFSGFLLGNRQNIAVVANDEFSLFPAKMPG